MRLITTIEIIRRNRWQRLRLAEVAVYYSISLQNLIACI